MLLLLFPAVRFGNAQEASKATQKTEEKEEKKETKWDVNATPGPSRDVSFQTDEGTWLSLDVSPRGDEIVFDLLGDLYLVPLAGGQAKRLTGGNAWDMQPRFSPDGEWIAFASDRAGGDNIWIIRRDGSGARQVTKEDFRLVNSPAWTPDGEYIAARKHFTSQRSLGAGEIWLYHRSGGAGVQMTKRPNDQKDAGEPAFSPDGKYLYYSQDTTPGAIFEYNKDPNDQIYVVQRLDRESGETTAFVTGPGGAVRPTPSRDGKKLAYVRRVRTKSVLFVQDLDSGHERPLYDGLDRDMQETWAIHGVYPGIAWTPDNQSIVFWAGGRIHAVDIASAGVRDIPFTAKVDLKVTDALRYPIDIAPASFKTRMLRWVQVAPGGGRTVYQTLGHLYVRDLPAGAPHRLTRDADFEFYPSFSRDGKWVVYTTWNDQDFGSIRMVSSSGGASRVITREKGHYTEPAFAPDGKKIVFRKAGGDSLRNSEWGRNPGLYVIDVEGGEAKLITRSGFRPHFGIGGERVFFQTFEPQDKRSLRSIELNGSHERTHLISEAATEFVVSPDERWVAFTQYFNAYITAFPKTGGSMEIAPKSQAVPVRQVSRDAGEYLHWSADSSRLYWALGPELFSRELKEAFSFVPGAPEKLPELPVTGTDIGFDVPADVPSGKLALVGARLITMEGDEVIEDGAIVIDGNRIMQVGRRSGVEIPPGAKVYNVSGNTVMPGLIDVHAHLSQGGDSVVPQQNWADLANLAFGVTTTHDPSNLTSTVFSAGEMARAGMIVAPRIFSTGTILYGAAGSFRASIDSLEDARSHLRRMKAVGAFTVKSYNQPRRDQRQQIIAAARELQMMVVPEGGSLLQHNLTMILDGHTGIEHSIPVARIYKDVLTLWASSQSGYTPTLIVGYGGIFGENYWYQHSNVWEDERLMSFVPRRIVDPRARRRMLVPEDDFNHINNARIAKELLDRGVSVQLGAHGQLQGLGAHWELWSLAQGGMTPLQALRCATLNGAHYLGMDRDLGSLKAGKLADVIVLEKNPLQDIQNSESVRYTIINGRMFDARTMDEIGNHPSKRKPLFFEVDNRMGAK